MENGVVVVELQFLNVCDRSGCASPAVHCVLILIVDVLPNASWVWNWYPSHDGGYLRRAPVTSLNTLSIWSWSMSSMNAAHFLLCPTPSWGKKLSIIRCYALFEGIHSICLIGHVKPFCALATRLVREQESIIVTFSVASPVLDKTRTEVSREFLNEPSESPKAIQRIR